MWLNRACAPRVNPNLSYSMLGLTLRTNTDVLFAGGRPHGSGSRGGGAHARDGRAKRIHLHRLLSIFRTSFLWGVG